MLTRDERIRWNDRMRKASRTPSPLPFRCECEDDDCNNIVYIAVDDFDQRRTQKPSGVHAAKHRKVPA